MRSGSRGMTLLELLVVLAIIGLLFAGGAVGLNISRSPRTLGLAAERVAGDLRAAQQRARQERAEYAVTFSVGSGAYEITKGGQRSGERVELPRGVIIADTTWREHRVTFSTYGNPDRTGTVRIQNRAGERAVDVDQYGRITTPP